MMSRPVVTPPAPMTGMLTAETISGSRSRINRSVPRCPPASKPSTTTAEAPNFSESLATRALPTIGTIGTPASRHQVKTSREKPAPAMTKVDALVERGLHQFTKRPYRDHDVDADDAVGQSPRLADLVAQFVGRQAAAGDDADAARFGDRGCQRRQRDAHRHAALDDGQSGGTVSDRERGHFHGRTFRGHGVAVNATTPGGRLRPPGGYVCGD